MGTHLLKSKISSGDRNVPDVLEFGWWLVLDTGFNRKYHR